jgi:hypothetical protein
MKAFVDLDGPMVPFNGALLDNGLLWAALAYPWYLDLRPLLIPYGANVGDPVVFLGDVLWIVCNMLGLPDLGPINALLCINKNNITSAHAKYGAKYAVDGCSTRVLAQFADASAHNLCREDYANGKWRLVPPNPSPGDGYYVYTDNLSKITVPALVIADNRFDITSPDDIKNFYLKKTRAALDTYMRVKGAAHIDLACGLNAPTVTFPAIGAWLKKACK